MVTGIFIALSHDNTVSDHITCCCYDVATLFVLARRNVKGTNIAEWTLTEIITFRDTEVQAVCFLRRLHPFVKSVCQISFYRKIENSDCSPADIKTEVAWRLDFAYNGADFGPRQGQEIFYSPLRPNRHSDQGSPFFTDLGILSQGYDDYSPSRA
jgi:hypothetical protein